jgi:hypothetical protein
VTAQKQRAVGGNPTALGAAYQMLVESDTMNVLKDGPHCTFPIESVALAGGAFFMSPRIGHSHASHHAAEGPLTAASCRATNARIDATS